MEYKEGRILTLGKKKYYLDQWDEECEHPCNKCELLDLCDNLADDLNKIDFQLCVKIDDLDYACNTKYTYFKRIE